MFVKRCGRPKENKPIFNKDRNLFLPCWVSYKILNREKHNQTRDAGKKRIRVMERDCLKQLELMLIILHYLNYGHI